MNQKRDFDEPLGPYYEMQDLTKCLNSGGEICTSVS